ncbi:MAG: AAA-like domain-containing protein [Spirochaetales bacterium]|nr:AAA-like domain-containing protein [Spirochaetales bacterium]
MEKEFNYTGTCIPEMHYMVDTTAKLEPTIKLIAKGKYLTINYPRQFGKTTTLLLLEKKLPSLGYLVISLDFQGVGDAIFQQEDTFVTAFAELMADALETDHEELSLFLSQESKDIHTLKDLSKLITRFTKKTDKKILLLIDEVDASSNNDLFIRFLGMLREKYLRRNAGKDFTFQSVILAGVYDVKSLKMKILEGRETKYNSPWNIAMDYPTDLSFTSEDIESMLTAYCRDKTITMDIPAIASRLHHFTSGHPFLVSRLCSIIDVDLMKKTETSWPLSYVDEAVSWILRENNTNFESLIKNLENNKDLYTLVEEILLNDTRMEYSEHNYLIKQGIIHGIFKKARYLVINNLIYAELIYNYMSLNLKIKSLLDKNLENYNFGNQFILPDSTLNFEKILLRFQAFMKEQYSEKDKAFVERNWRLLYLAFIKPIINGHGFDFKETHISEEKRLDVVITFYNNKYISELKIWGGPEKHQRGIEQLADYLKRQDADAGYLVIFDFKKTMDYKQEKITVDGRDIFMVWV